MTKTRIWIAMAVAGLLVAPSLTAAGQQQAPPAPPAPAAPPAQPTAPPRRPFQPPSDGKLTTEQVKKYIEVRRLAMSLPKPDATATDPVAQITRLVGSLNNESAAASQLGVDIEEFRWVSLQVSASGVRPAGDVLPLGDELTKALLAATGKAREAMGLPAAEPGRSGAESTAAAAAYNRELLDKFKPELDALAPR
jgi:hypothetical protein